MGIIASMADEQVTSSQEPLESEAYQFSYLYGSFEAFMSANNLTPQTYPAYHTLFNALINISNYSPTSSYNDGGINDNNTQQQQQQHKQKQKQRLTWRECVSAFAKSYSASELKRAKFHMLREKLRTFDDATRERFLALWYDAYVTLNETTTKLNHIASSFASEKLSVDCFNVWISKYHSIIINRRRAEQGSALLTKANSFGKLHSKFIIIKENEAIADGLVVSKKLTLWKKRLAKIKQQSQTAVVIHDSNLCASVLDDWRQSTTEKITDSIYLSKLAAKMLGIWKLKTATIIHQQNLAVDWDYSQVIDSTLSKWIASYDTLVIDNTNKAIEVYADTLALSTFNTWRRTLDHTIKLETLQAKKDVRLVSGILKSWQTRNRQIREARRFRDFMSCYKFFRTWKQNEACAELIRKKNVDIASFSLKVWALRSREAVFVRVSNRALAMDVLAIWRDKATASRNSREQLLESYLGNKQQLLAQNCWGVWKHNTRLQVQNMEIAVALHDDSVAHGSFNSILTKFDKLQIQKLEAESIYNTSLINKGLKQWKFSFVESKTQSRETLFINFCAHRDKLLKTKVFNHLLNTHLDIDSMTEAADNIRTAKMTFIQTNILHKWIQKRRAAHKNRELAETLDRDSATYKYIDIWSTRLRHLRLLDNEARRLKSEQDVQHLDQVYKVWRIRMFKLSTKNRDADDFYDRSINIKLKSMWRNWKLKTVSKIQERQQRELERSVVAITTEMEQQDGETLQQRVVVNGHGPLINITENDSSSTLSLTSSRRTGTSLRANVFRGVSESNNGLPVTNSSNTKGINNQIFIPSSLPNGHSIRNGSNENINDNDVSPLKNKNVTHNNDGRRRSRIATIASGNATTDTTTTKIQTTPSPERNYALETPTRARIRRPVPMTSISRWKLSMTAPPLSSLTPNNNSNSIFSRNNNNNNDTSLENGSDINNVVDQRDENNKLLNEYQDSSSSSPFISHPFPPPNHQ